MRRRERAIRDEEEVEAEKKEEKVESKPDLEGENEDHYG